MGKKPVLANKGAIGLSLAGVTDNIKTVAAVATMGEKLFGYKTTDDEMITDGLKTWGIEATPANIAKVRALM
jgi:hypothetical protein